MDSTGKGWARARHLFVRHKEAKVMSLACNSIVGVPDLLTFEMNNVAVAHRSFIAKQYYFLLDD